MSGLSHINMCDSVFISPVVGVFVGLVIDVFGTDSLDEGLHQM